MQIKTKLIIGTGVAALSLFAGSGTASAAPDVEAIVNSNCTYPQVIAALNAKSPEVAAQITENPLANSWLQQLVAAPPDVRRQMVAQVQAMPAMQGYTGLINQIAKTCDNF
jgi:hemophore-related protein